MLPEAVCFDYRGTLVDHRTDREISGMTALLDSLQKRKVRLAVVSRFPAPMLEERLGRLKVYFGEHVFSSSSSTKLDCIRAFADNIGVTDLSRICFVDDKPANLLPVARGSSVRVIGFKGSNKYPETAGACKEAGIPFAGSAEQLEQIILKE
jgi:FMN phosphatase YigB (HAD superfamily)